MSIRKNGECQDVKDRAGMAWDESSAVILAEYATDEDAQVREVVASNNCTGEDTLRMLVGDPVESVAEAARWTLDCKWGVFGG